MERPDLHMDDPLTDDPDTDDPDTDDPDTDDPDVDDPDVDDAQQTVPVRVSGRGPSVRPALVVLGIAVLLVLIFGVGSALTGSSSPPSATHAPVRGVTLATRSGTSALRPIELPGTPPAAVLSSIVVPDEARTVSSVPWDELTQFSGTMTFSLRSSQATIVTFFQKELRARGWSIVSVGAAHDQPRSTEVLAQLASDDGSYWNIGIVVAPTTFGSGATAATDSTRFTLDLYESFPGTT